MGLWGLSPRFTERRAYASVLPNRDESTTNTIIITIKSTVRAEQNIWDWEIKKNSIDATKDLLLLESLVQLIFNKYSLGVFHTAHFEPPSPNGTYTNV
jgi:hypothetical protein